LLFNAALIKSEEEEPLNYEKPKVNKDNLSKLLKPSIGKNKRRTKYNTKYTRKFKRRQ